MITIILIILVILWIYFMQFHKIQTEKSIFIDDLIKNNLLKTGDLILFKAYNNFNSIFHGSYFGHIGIIYIKDGVPMLFEANGVEYMNLKNHHSKKGVFLSPVLERVNKYKGRCFLKQLDKPLSNTVTAEFEKFINYCLENVEYDYNVISGGISRWLGISKCGKNTDCGQLVFLSLIKLRLINIEEYDVPRLHHLKYVCDLERLENNSYNSLIEIIDHPFAE